MDELPYTLYRAADVRELDRTAIEDFHIPGIELMNRAGAACYELLVQHYPDAEHIVVCCGSGNNAGDGYVIARLAHEDNRRVTIVSGSDPEQLKGDARTAWGAAKADGLKITPFDASLFRSADVIVDALFGTGLDRELSGEYLAMVEAMNSCNSPVLAVDIPSGIHADSGRVLGVAVRAQQTVTFIGLKQGLFTGEAPDYTGQLLFSDLKLPAGVYEHVISSTERISWQGVQSLLPPRARNAHKGDSGHVLIVGGNHGMAGAACLAAEAAGRAGAGLITVATRAEHTVAMAATLPEVMWQAAEDEIALRSLMARATVIAIGPGLGQDAWGRKMLATVLDSPLPLIVDADALNLLALEGAQREHWILTPHPGEAARLLSSSAAEVNQQRFESAIALAERFQAQVVLKGAGSLVVMPAGPVALCTDGNPGMAVAGMGDTLTGIIAAMVAQGLELYDAARLGVALHAAAGDVAAQAGERGLMAGDVIASLRGVLNRGGSSLK